MQPQVTSSFVVGVSQNDPGSKSNDDHDLAEVQQYDRELASLFSPSPDSEAPLADKKPRQMEVAPYGNDPTNTSKSNRLFVQHRLNVKS